MKTNENTVVAAMRSGEKTARQLVEATSLSVTTVRKALDQLNTAGRLRIVRRHVGKTKAGFFTLIG